MFPLYYSRYLIPNWNNMGTSIFFNCSKFSCECTLHKKSGNFCFGHFCHYCYIVYLLRSILVLLKLDHFSIGRLRCAMAYDDIDTTSDEYVSICIVCSIVDLCPTNLLNIKIYKHIIYYERAR
jgi:hypothetical protein